MSECAYFLRSKYTIKLPKKVFFLNVVACAWVNLGKNILSQVYSYESNRRSYNTFKQNIQIIKQPVKIRQAARGL